MDFVLAGLSSGHRFGAVWVERQESVSLCKLVSQQHDQRTFYFQNRNTIILRPQYYVVGRYPRIVGRYHQAVTVIV